MLQLTTILFLISLSLLATLHYLAIQFFLYWRFEWFDIPMHLFGGMIVALGFFTLRDLRLVSTAWIKPFYVLVGVLIVALSWEMFELFAVEMDNTNYLGDTILDLIMGITGGLIGYWVGSRLRNL